MVVIGFIGEMRSGKTLAMTIEGYKEYCQGKKIFSNYALDFPAEFIDDQMLTAVTKDNKTQMFDGSVTMIDEIHVYMDSRASATKKNRMISYFVTQSGKLDTVMMWTSQYAGQVDKRLRLNTQIIYKAERYILVNRKKKLLRQDDKREDFYIDLHKYFFRDVKGRMGFVYDRTITIKQPKKYFGLYNTRERINFTGDYHVEKDNDKGKL